ncbi:carbohydrate ABC transporter permease [Murimonas intestini]|uniref:Carbohydrate ABC transporter membrane protein 1 (CUT1 family) n=1 Tax=Murimonas intestini TaxID=1337051 RepID=A0AB73T019_9FIRM|nr:sugar ABC transporter permease [Murimonas intestini]MCR1843252.1 sugar ABC transporter permease [Murimonas intestini]MCR1868655.1 sugar ABC transporter permease [Murimonas intestini]MCR1885089.1 sugar ABC transporter permease [Murimonas intestini]
MKTVTKTAGNYAAKKKRKDTISAYIFLAPALISFGLFIGLPVILSAVLSFFKYNLVNPPQFVGLENIKKMFTDKGLFTAFGNTFKFLLILCPIHCGLGMILAFMVYRAKRFQFFFRSAIYFPSIVTTASVAIAWGYLFSTDMGAINYFVRLLGGTNIPWLTDRVVVYVTIALFSFWKFIGTTFLYYFIGMQNIPDVYYEAAQIDGAGIIQTFRHITLPLLSPTIFFVIITNIVSVFQIFDEPYLLTNGGPGTATRTIALEIYQTAFQDMNIGYGGTISFVLFLIILVITIIQFKGQNKWVVYDYE